MNFYKSSSFALIVLLGSLLVADAGILGGLKGLGKLKDALPLAAGAGLLGTMKLALLAKAGLALGGLGTILGAAALKHKPEDKEIIYYAHAQDYGHSHYGGYGGDGYGYRRKREAAGVDNDIKKLVQSREAFDFVKKSDPTNCSERLICEIANKATRRPTEVQLDEMAMLTMIESNSNEKYKSYAHTLLEGAMYNGQVGSDCSSLYPTCSFSADDMMKLIRISTDKIIENSPDTIKQIIEN